MPGNSVGYGSILFVRDASHILIDLLSEQIELDVRAKLKADEERGVIMPGKPNYLAPMFTGALVYVARWWILHDWQPTKEKLVEETVNILKIM